MMKNLLLIIILTIFCLPMLRADVLVLVHGYASSASTWEYSGVNRVLMVNGWQYAGSPGRQASPAKTFYMMELPATAPLMVQNKLLLEFLRGVREQHPTEPLTLVGHSAGGLVARLALLQGNTANISRLVTIASPHTGTPRARQGLEVVDDIPFFCPGPGWRTMKSLVGGDSYRYLKNSRGALIDMLPPGYGNLISWANQQPHPAIEYHAIVRQQGDELVPAFSQDLNSVPALEGKARVWLTNSGHALNWRDGELLVSILSGPG